ncbi:MAG: NAD(P)H-dependent oxidoreductase [Leadbetterella sp.]|nr:NAD(P)H-dependent oxidoreductase [Leadbetterella sp.]
MKIEIISGSPREASITVRLARHLYQVLQEKEGVEAGLIDVRSYDLPFVQQVWSAPGKVPAEFKDLGDRIFSADAFILVSPEYNGGYSPALKNLLDHFPKQSRKAFGIATGTDGALGAMRAAQQLVQLVAALFGILSPRLLITPHADKKFDTEGHLLDPDFRKAVDIFVEEFLWLTEKLNEK